MKPAVLNQGLQALQEELDAMGGGDTRIADTTVVVKVSDKIETANSIIRVEGNGDLVVTDPRSSKENQSRKYSCRHALPASPSAWETASGLMLTVGEPCTDWLWDGFNTAVLTYGQVGTGKSHSLFEQGNGGLTAGIMRKLFAKIDASEDPGSYTVALSCWDLWNNNVIDLFGGLGRSTQNKFAAVQARSLDDAMHLLQRARESSTNWDQLNSSDGVQLAPSCAHAFVRVALHNTKGNCVSTLHLVDLVGVAVANGSTPHVLRQDRLVVNQQLLSLGRLLRELADQKATRAAEAISMKASKLTQILAPLIGGNCKSVFVAFVSPHADHFLDTVNTLRLMSKLGVIQCPCIRLTGIPRDTLGVLDVQQVLSSSQTNTQADWHVAASTGDSAPRHDGTQLAPPGLTQSPKLPALLSPTPDEHVQLHDRLTKLSRLAGSDESDPTSLQVDEQARRVAHLIMLQADRHGNNQSVCVNDMQDFLEGTTYEGFAEWLNSNSNLNNVVNLSVTELERAVAQYLTGSSIQQQESVDGAPSSLIDHDDPCSLRTQLRQDLDTMLSKVASDQMASSMQGSSNNKLLLIEPQDENHDCVFAKHEQSEVQTDLQKKATAANQNHLKYTQQGPRQADNSIPLTGPLWTQIQSTVSPLVWQNVKAGLLQTHVGGEADKVTLGAEPKSNIADVLFDAMDVNSDGVVDKQEFEHALSYLTTQPSPTSPPGPSGKPPVKQHARDSMEQQPVSRAEISALKGNYETLLSLLKRQEEERQRHMEEKEGIKMHYEEHATEMEIFTQTLQVENLKMRDTIRQMLSQSQGMEVAFDLYESDISCLENQVQNLQIGEFHVNTEFQALCLHNQELQKSKRQAAVQRRCFEEAGKKANKLGAEVKRERAEHQKAAAALHTAHEQVVALENECGMLREQNFEMIRNADALRRQVVALKEAARTSKLNMKKELLASKYTASQPRITAPKGAHLHRTCREICNKLELQLHNFDPKCTGLINRLKRELTKLENERQEKSDREQELVELLFQAQESLDTLQSAS